MSCITQNYHKKNKASHLPQGNLKQLQEMKGWHGQELLYFGDHPYSDLADVSLNHSWRTGAIIWELDVSLILVISTRGCHSGSSVFISPLHRSPSC